MEAASRHSQGDDTDTATTQTPIEPDHSVSPPSEMLQDAEKGGVPPPQEEVRAVTGFKVREISVALELVSSNAKLTMPYLTAVVPLSLKYPDGYVRLRSRQHYSSRHHSGMGLEMMDKPLSTLR